MSDLTDALDLLTDGQLLNRIDRHNADEFVLAVSTVAAAARRVVEADEIWWCEEHASQFIKEYPDEHDMCLWMLYEDKWNSLPEPEPCRMVRRLLLPPEKEGS